MSNADQTEQEFQQKPEIPEDDVTILRQLFRKLDVFSRGYVAYEDLQLGDAFDKGTFDIHANPREIFEAYDLDRSGFIDEDEFIHMMCPHEYRYAPHGQDEAESEGQLLLRWTMFFLTPS